MANYIVFIIAVGCQRGGVVAECALPEGYEKTCSITRSLIEACGQGLALTSSVPFICTDNTLRDHAMLG